MSDLINRLRKPRISHHQVSRDWEPYDTVAKTHPVEAIKLEAADALEQQAGEIERLKAENAELRKDAARLDWAEKHTLVIDCVADPDNLIRVYWGPDDATQSASGRTVRAAIDAAMEGKKCDEKTDTLC